MMIGSMNGIETQYKNVIHAKREIPATYCTSEIQDILYASGRLTGDYAKEEESEFDFMIEQLDEKAAQYETKKTVKHTESLFSKKMRKNIRDGVWIRVDTDGKFWIGNNKYVISDQEAQYQPVKTEYGDYYAMDKILYAGGKFYDMNYDEVTVYQIGGILPYRSFEVGTET